MTPADHPRAGETPRPTHSVTDANRAGAARLRLAVTGASGFVGRHLVAHLRAGGHAVVPIARHAGGDPSTHVVADYADATAMAAALAGVQVVVHLAARAHQRDPADAADVYRRANVVGTCGVIEACQAAAVQRLVFVSSIGVLGNRSPGRPLTEADPPAPAEPYAVSKLEAEREVSRRLAQGPTDYVIVRPPLVYGPGCPGNFALLLRLAARAPIVPLGAIHAPRRFIGIGNLVEALEVAAWHPGASRRTFVLADGDDVDVAQILRIAMTRLGRPASRLWNVPPGLLRSLATAAGRRSAYDKLCAALQVDPSAFCAATGWQPRIRPSDGLAEAAAACSPP